MARRARVTASFEVDIDEELSTFLDIGEGTHQEECDALDEALTDNELSWDELIEAARNVIVKVEPI